MNTSSRFPVVPALIVFVLLGLLAWGVVLDRLAGLDNRVLFVSFHVSGIVGLCLGALLVFKRCSHFWVRIACVIAVILIWRVSYFPIMVIGGFMASVGEYAMSTLGVYQVYPIFVLSVALLNFVAATIAAYVVAVIFGQFAAHKEALIFRGALMSVALPLLVIAAAVSFSHPSDWHSVPDTSFIDTKPLPSPTLPNVNPYWAALEEKQINWQQRILFAAAAITYDYVPENARWSTVVRGVLENEFVSTTEVTTAFCTKIHYRAFITAHPYIMDAPLFEQLVDSY